MRSGNVVQRIICFFCAIFFLALGATVADAGLSPAKGYMHFVNLFLFVIGGMVVVLGASLLVTCINTKRWRRAFGNEEGLKEWNYLIPPCSKKTAEKSARYFIISVVATIIVVIGVIVIFGIRGETFFAVIIAGTATLMPYAAWQEKTIRRSLERSGGLELYEPWYVTKGKHWLFFIVVSVAFCFFVFVVMYDRWFE